MIKYIFSTSEGKLYKQNEEEIKNGESEVWIMNREEFKALEGGYPHKKALNQSLFSIRYCKAEIFGNCIQGVMKIPFEKNEKSQLEFGFYLIKNKLIFIGEGNRLQSVLERADENLTGKASLRMLLLTVFEVLIENDIIYLLKIEDKFSSAEEELLKNKSKNFYEKLIFYRKRLSALHSYYGQLENIGYMMQSDLTGETDENEKELWRLYTNRTERLHNYVDVLRENLLELRELYQYQNDLRQNQIMTFLTVVTTIFLPLTLIVGWYGMNFTDMLAFKTSWGYPLVCIASVVIVIAEIIYFKKKKML